MDCGTVYVPTVRVTLPRRSALRHLVETFFDGSAENLVAALLAERFRGISGEELDRLTRLFTKDRKER